MNLQSHEPTTERISRFQSLQAGQYWRALRSVVEQGIAEGMVLLIQSIRWVDDAPHTVILRSHPSKFGTTERLEIPQEDGSIKRIHLRYEEHRFLLDEFLSGFEFEPDHQSVRADEVRQVQNKINALQAELVETQCNPALLAAIVEEGLRDEGVPSSEGKSNDAGQGLPVAVSRDESHVAELATGTVANAIGSGITTEGIAAMKVAAQREHKIATVKAKWIQGKTTAIAETIKQMTPFYEEQAAAALAQTEDVRTYVAKLLKGIESLDLYVGKDVEVETLREGAPAGKDVPLTFVQRKLLMDEELAVWADVGEWFDFSNDHKFVEALQTHDGLVSQIFPTERCVLVMATTRREIDYGDVWTNVARNQRNKMVFLLVRNGMNIHRVYSPVESHLKSARLFPTRNEQDGIFRGFDGSQIKFEDVAYTDKLGAHELHALHYKRFLLLACGLDHRLKLFGDFYDGPESLDFVSMDFQERHCRFLHDDDGEGLLPGEDRKPVAAWIKEMNTYLRSGSRVLCNWVELMNPDTAPAACKQERDSTGSLFDRRYRPSERMSVAVAYKDGASICLDVEVSGYSYSSHANRTFNCKVNLSKFENGGWKYTDLPFLCLDAVDPADLDWYIHHRGSRQDHLSFIRFFKEALRFITGERLEEQDTRRRLAKALSDGNVAAAADQGSIIDQAVIAWRAANRGKALPRFEGEVAPPAWTSLLNQMHMLAGEGERRVTEIGEFVQQMGLTPLRLVLSGGAKLVVYAAPRPDECDNRLETHAWVHRITVERGKTKYSEKHRRWTLLPLQSASETTLHQWEGATDWAGRVSIFSSYDRKIEIMGRANSFAAALEPFSKALSEAEFEFQFSMWEQKRNRLLKNSKYVLNPAFAVPFGLIYYKHTKELQFLCVGSENAHGILAALAPNEEARNRLRNAFVDPYKKRGNAHRSFEDAAAVQYRWSALAISVDLVENSDGHFLDGAIGVDNVRGKSTSPLLADWFEKWKPEHKDYARVWIADSALDVNGRLTIDTLLGITLPEGYEPVRVREIRLEVAGKAATPFHHWLDICPGAEEPGGDDSFFSSRSSSEISMLVGSVEKDRVGGYSSSYRNFLTRDEAREAILKWVSAPRRIVSASEIPDAPKPPDGYERWFILDS